MWRHEEWAPWRGNRSPYASIAPAHGWAGTDVAARGGGAPRRGNRSPYATIAPAHGWAGTDVAARGVGAPARQSIALRNHRARPLAGRVQMWRHEEWAPWRGNRSPYASIAPAHGWAGTDVAARGGGAPRRGNRSPYATHRARPWLGGYRCGGARSGRPGAAVDRPTQPSRPPMAGRVQMGLRGGGRPCAAVDRPTRSGARWRARPFARRRDASRRCRSGPCSPCTSPTRG